MFRAAIAAIAVAATPSTALSDHAVSNALDIAVSTCEQWTLNPATWADGFDQFPLKSGMAARGLVSVSGVPEVALPPPAARRAMHHWRVPIGDGGIYVSASDQLPLCHLAGGGPLDLKSGVDAELVSSAFLKRWKADKSTTRGDIFTSKYVSLIDPKLSIVISRSTKVDDRLDRVQVIATTQYDIGK